MSKQTHWIVGAGRVGCLYDYGPHFAETKEQVIAELCELFDDIGEDEIRTLCQNLELYCIHYFNNPYKAGADYCEIYEEDGPCPEDDE